MVDKTSRMFRDTEAQPVKEQIIKKQIFLRSRTVSIKKMVNLSVIKYLVSDFYLLDLILHIYESNSTESEDDNRNIPHLMWF